MIFILFTMLKAYAPRVVLINISITLKDDELKFEPETTECITKLIGEIQKNFKGVVLHNITYSIDKISSDWVA